MYIHIYVYIYTNIYIYVYIYVCIHIYMYRKSYLIVQGHFPQTRPVIGGSFSESDLRETGSETLGGKVKYIVRDPFK